MRDKQLAPDKVVELWNFSPSFRKNPREPGSPAVYLSNAEHIASLFTVPVALARPKLYIFDDYPYELRHNILLHVQGKSHGRMPDHIIEHVIKKYEKTGQLYQIGLVEELTLNLPKIVTPNLWELVRVISQAKMFIGMDSGPSWIAGCYPDVVAKKVRMKPTPEHFKTWVPLEVNNIHAHWDDRIFKICNPTEEDIGFTHSYKTL